MLFKNRYVITFTLGAFISFIVTLAALQTRVMHQYKKAYQIGYAACLDSVHKEFVKPKIKIINEKIK